MAAHMGPGGDIGSIAFANVGHQIAVTFSAADAELEVHLSLEQAQAMADELTARIRFEAERRAEAQGRVVVPFHGRARSGR